MIKNRLKEDKILVVPVAHDALAAKIIEKVGFEAVYVAGFSSSASVLGKPDVGLLTMDEMVDRVAKVREAVSLPIFADIDTGFGNAINVQRTVREFERAGASVLQMEDQVSPKKCGHMAGRDVISTEEMVGKVKAATDARRSDDTLIMARTDARTEHGIDVAIERGLAYQEAGADIIFVEAVESEDEMRQVTEAFELPVMANMLEGGKTPLLTNQELEQIGYDVVPYPLTTVLATAKAVEAAMQELFDKGTTRDYFEELMLFDDFNDLVGLKDVQEKEALYQTGRDL